MKDLTKDSKRGDIVTLNCGYGGGPDETDCRVLRAYDTQSVWGAPERGFEVEILGTGERFTTSVSLPA